MTGCVHKNIHGQCAVVEKLAGHTWCPAEQECRLCKRMPRPQAINPVTISQAIAARSIHNQPYDDLIEIQNAPITGPGTHLKKILSWFGNYQEVSCDCEKRELIMNSWGPDTCEQRIHVIVGWLLEEGAKRNIPGFLLNEHLAGLAVRRAIRLSRKSK